jgi:VCBS repeat-containing protein
MDRGGVSRVTGTLSISDPDINDSPVSFPDVPATPGDSGYGSFAMTGGNWTFMLDTAHALVRTLLPGQDLTDTYTFTATDGSSKQVSVTIHNPGDPVSEMVEPSSMFTPPRSEAGSGDPAAPTAPEPAGEPSEDTPAEAPADPSSETVPSTDPLADAGVVVPRGSDPIVVPDEVLLSVLSGRPSNDPVQSSAFSVDKPDEAAQSFLKELKSFWVESPAADAPQIAEIRFSQTFWDGLDKMAADLDKSVQREEARTQLSAEAAAGVGISLTAGFVSWALRAGSMAASLVAAMPSWRNFDPMPVLAAEDEECAGDGDDERALEEEDNEVDELFEQ